MKIIQLFKFIFQSIETYDSLQKARTWLDRNLVSYELFKYSQCVLAANRATNFAQKKKEKRITEFHSIQEWLPWTKSLSADFGLISQSNIFFFIQLRTIGKWLYAFVSIFLTILSVSDSDINVIKTYCTVKAISLIITSDLKQGLPWWLRQQRILLQYRRLGFNPCIRKIPQEKGTATSSSVLAGVSQEQRSRASYSPWGHKELDTTEQLYTHTVT